MGYALSLFSFVFLAFGLAAQIIAFMTSYMYENKIISSDHQGIFRRCEFLGLFKCRWWTINDFNYDQRWLQAVVVLSLISVALIGLLVLFALIGLIPRFKSRGLNSFIGVTTMLNAVVLASILALYTTLNDQSITFQGYAKVYSWSYWLLYGALGLDLLASIFYCCNQPSI